jgi:hypothetical protein
MTPDPEPEETDNEQDTGQLDSAPDLGGWPGQ